MSRSRSFTTLVTLTLITIILLACGQRGNRTSIVPMTPGKSSERSATLPAPADKKELVVGTSSDITRLDPHQSNSVNDITVSFNLFDTLTTRDVELALKPLLATGWKSTSQKTWEFQLRKDAKFHNGEPVTAPDVKFSILRTLDPESKSRVTTVFTTVDKIDALDAHTVIFTTKAPDPLLPARLAFYGGQIMPEKYFKQVGPDEFNAKPIGSGPVKFGEWVKDERLVLTANEQYWGGKPDFERVVFRPIPEAAARVASLLAGETDIITRLPTDQVERLNQQAKVRAEGAFYAGFYALIVNSKIPPLDKPKVKQALSLAIDRESIIKNLWKNQGISPNGPVAKGDTIGYDPNRPPLAYDPAKAKQLLQEAGYKGEPILLETTDGHLINDRVMSEAIVEMWKQVGVAVQLQLVDAATRGQNNLNKSWKGLYWSDPTSTLQDPDGMMWRLLQPGGPHEYWRHDKFEKLGEQARTSFSEKGREANYFQMTDIFLEHFPWIPIIQPIESYGVANYVDWKPVSNQLFQLRRPGVAGANGLQFNRAK